MSVEKMKEVKERKAAEKEDVGTREELSLEELMKTTGAGDPFKDVSRVPTQPITSEARKKL